MSDSRRTTAGRNNRAWCLLPIFGLATLGVLMVAAQEPQPPELKQTIYSVAELRKKYPFVSIEPRLEYERKRIEAEKDRAAPMLSLDAEKNLLAADARQAKPVARWYNIRTDSLKLLHSEHAEEFIKRQGFGVSRLPTPGPDQLEFPSPKPIEFARLSAAADEFSAGPALALRKDEPAQRGEDALRMPPLDVLADYFEQHQLYFANPNSFGYFLDRKHVAGFLPHAFVASQDWIYPIPRSPEEAKALKSDKWVISSLELVSLLKHEQPVTYVSDRLPKMDELKEAKTRPLTEFESQSLKTLVDGREVVASATPNRILMLGALRASKSCIYCHYVESGELLGAFSYDLQRDPPLVLQPRSEVPVN